LPVFSLLHVGVPRGRHSKGPRPARGLVAETIADFFAGKNNADGLDDICPRNNLVPDSSGCDGASARKIPERLILPRSSSLAPWFPSLKTLVAHFFSLEQK